IVPWELANLVLPLGQQASGAALLAAALGLAVLGFVNAQRIHLRVVEVPAPDSVRGLTVVQLTDVHVGSRSGAFMGRAVRAGNGAGPDYVLITGDRGTSATSAPRCGRRSRSSRRLRSSSSAITNVTWTATPSAGGSSPWG